MLEKARQHAQETKAAEVFANFGFRMRLHWNDECRKYELRAVGIGIEKYVWSIERWIHSSPTQRIERMQTIQRECEES